jgi:hypothetical protein
VSPRRFSRHRLSRRRSLAGLLAVLVVLLCGCAGLPTSGVVHTRPDESGQAANEAPYFAPPGPTIGDTRDGVVRGFLLAMQANPPSTAVARQFLSDRARAAWKPVRGTIVYDDSSVELAGPLVNARLSGAHRLDPHGAWEPGSGAHSTTIGFSLVRESGEWRIDNPPDALAVPSSYFSSLFVPLLLYFFDRTGTVLVPTRVYLPRGEQTASNLVRGLLARPGDRLANVVTSAFPANADLDLSVVVNDAGVAEVPLGNGMLKLSQSALEHAVVQLAWTLRQVPGGNRIRITADGATVPLPGGQSDAGVRVGAIYDPLTAPESNLVGVVGGKVVLIDSDEATPVGGPLGRGGFSLRSVALDADGHQVAAVAGSGRRVYLAPDRGPRVAKQVRNVLDNATDVLRPSFDRFGGLWLVDRTARGAVVHLEERGRSRVVPIPGISGQRISAFTLTQDGTRFVASAAGHGSPGLLVSALVRGGGGRFVEAQPASRVDLPATDGGPVRDLSQYGATTVAVLTQAARGPGRIAVVELDGSPGDPSLAAPMLVPGGPVTGFATSPDPDLAPFAVTRDHRLLTLTVAGRWERSTLTGVLTATYPQ